MRHFSSFLPNFFFFLAFMLPQLFHGLSSLGYYGFICVLCVCHIMNIITFWPLLFPSAFLFPSCHFISAATGSPKKDAADTNLRHTYKNADMYSHFSFFFSLFFLKLAYPALTALKGSQVAIPCNISHHHHPHQPSLPLSSASSSSNGSSSSFPASFANSPSLDDAFNLILWYRGDDINGSPIYTVDGRDLAPWPAATGNENSTSNTRHFVGPQLQGRAKANLAARPSAVLLIEDVQAADSGTYWCRVDFRWTRTLISTVQLNVHGSFVY